MKTLNDHSILSDPAANIRTVIHHPWRLLRDRFPEWEVVRLPLPSGVLGGVDAKRRTILLDSRQMQAQLRCTLDHELHHAEAGDIGCQHPSRERAIDQASARRLVPIKQLLEIVVWANGIEELAEGCFVDVATMRCRIKHLHPSERAAIRQALAVRDNEESS